MRYSVSTNFQTFDIGRKRKQRWQLNRIDSENQVKTCRKVTYTHTPPVCTAIQFNGQLHRYVLAYSYRRHRAKTKSSKWNGTNFEKRGTDRYSDGNANIILAFLKRHKHTRIHTLTGFFGLNVRKTNDNRQRLNVNHTVCMFAMIRT